MTYRIRVTDENGREIRTLSTEKKRRHRHIWAEQKSSAKDREIVENVVYKPTEYRLKRQKSRAILKNCHLQ